MKKIVAVNGSPRTGWNTDLLVTEAARGAEEAGAEVRKFDLYRLEKYSGCISCFGCKRQGHRGVCIFRDGLAPVLDAIREADGVILGSPNYLGDISAGLRALYERLTFQRITYRDEPPMYGAADKKVLFLMTSNSPLELYADMGYDRMVERYRATLTRLVGPTEVFLCGETLQVPDYGKFDWTYFDPEARRRRRETVFPRELAEVRRLGAALVTD